MKIADKIGIFLTGVATLPSVWIMLSWIDVICHNTTDFCYAPWNIFTLIF